jgi:hypothetical protein
VHHLAPRKLAAAAPESRQAPAWLLLGRTALASEWQISGLAA